MMGDLFATQVWSHIATNVLHSKRPPLELSFFGEKAVGHYLTEKVFRKGNLLNWMELTKHATGEPLTAKAFAAMFVVGAEKSSDNSHKEKDNEPAQKKAKKH
jgi:Zn-dependent M32 family carboxypeptidase